MTLHKIALLINFLTIFISISTQSRIALILGYLLFFLVTSFSMLKMMILLAIIMTILMFLFPPLAFFASILALFLFWRRLKFIKNNLLPIFLGLVFYSTTIPFYLFIKSLWLSCIDTTYTLFATIIFLASISTLFLHFSLSLLYIKGYTPSSALGIMGGVPLFITSIILPFLKISDTYFDTYFLPDIPTFEQISEAHNVVTEFADLAQAHLHATDLPPNTINPDIHNGTSHHS